jgi:hypothetical protein
MTVWIYVNRSRDIGDVERFKVFATPLDACPRRCTASHARRAPITDGN